MERLATPTNDKSAIDSQKPLMWELLLSLSADELRMKCWDPRDSTVRNICKTDDFWESKVHRDFPTSTLEPTEDSTWKDLYDQLVFDNRINVAVDDIFERLRNDIYMKRKSIVDYYNQKLHDEFRDPKKCTSETRPDIPQNSWMLLMGPEGEEHRIKLMNRDIQSTFKNYYKGTLQADTDSDYYGVMFVGLTWLEGYYVYGTPDTVGASATHEGVEGSDEPVYYPYIDSGYYDDGASATPGGAFDSYYQIMPNEINMALHDMFAQNVGFIKIYMFMSPPKKNAREDITVLRDEEESTSTYTEENFVWIIDGVGAWTVTVEDTKLFVNAVIASETGGKGVGKGAGSAGKGSIYPIIMETSPTGCHHRKCGPWI